MAKPRLQKTLADYVVIAINPALIMLLVGSLVFFLLAVGYEGRFADRLHWILGWFVLAIVLVARIAIEQGPEQARVYGLALAGVTSLVMFRFVDAPWIAIPLLGVIWWCANKLTWDSTLVDDNEDASGEGLLQHAGLDDSPADVAGDVPAQSDEPDDENEGDDQVPTAVAPPVRRPEKQKRTHAPGLWVVYFSLLALPLFGIGQLFIPASNAEGRESAFRLLFVYVASALALLLTTSFLGLRRYLRQRRIRMPAPISAIWIAQGSVMIAAILAVCILLPRPNATYSATAMLERIAEKEQQASRHAQLGGEGVDEDGRRIGKGESNDNENANDGENSEQNDEATQSSEKGNGGKQDTQQNEKQRQNGSEPQQNRDQQQQDGSQGQQGSGDRQQDKGEQQGNQAEQSEQQGRNQQSSDGKDAQSQGGRQQGGQSGGKGQGGEQGKASDQNKGDDRSDQQQSDQSGEDSDVPRPESDEREGPQPETPKPSLSATGWLAAFGKWLIYAFLAALLLWYVIRNRAALMESLRQMYLWFLGLFGWTMQESAAAGEEEDILEAARSARPFASFENPFANGRAARMKPGTLVVYTFEALQAWAREQGIERPGDQTPLEFVKTVAARHADLAGEVGVAGRLYARVAYASGSPSRGEVDRLEMLWRGLSQPS